MSVRSFVFFCASAVPGPTPGRATVGGGPPVASIKSGVLLSSGKAMQVLPRPTGRAAFFVALPCPNGGPPAACWTHMEVRLSNYKSNVLQIDLHSIRRTSNLARWRRSCPTEAVARLEASSTCRRRADGQPTRTARPQVAKIITRSGCMRISTLLACMYASDRSTQRK